MLARFPLAQFGATRGSPNPRQFGTKSVLSPRLRAWSSYFSCNIAAEKKIISLGPTSSFRSPGHDDILDLTGGNNHHRGSPAAAFARPVFARFLRRRRGCVPARFLVTCDVPRTDHQRTPVLRCRACPCCSPYSPGFLCESPAMSPIPKTAPFADSEIEILNQ